MLRNLTTDLDLIKRVLRSSTKLQLDESGPQCMVRPRLNCAARTTIILRDIPKDVKEEVSVFDFHCLRPNSHPCSFFCHQEIMAVFPHPVFDFRF